MCVCATDGSCYVDNGVCKTSGSTNGLAVDLEPACISKTLFRFRHGTVEKISVGTNTIGIAHSLSKFNKLGYFTKAPIFDATLHFAKVGSV